MICNFCARSITPDEATIVGSLAACEEHVEQLPNSIAVRLIVCPVNAHRLPRPWFTLDVRVQDLEPDYHMDELTDEAVEAGWQLLEERHDIAAIFLYEFPDYPEPGHERVSGRMYDLYRPGPNGPEAVAEQTTAEAVRSRLAIVPYHQMEGWTVVTWDATNGEEMAVILDEKPARLWLDEQRVLPAIEREERADQRPEESES